MSEPIANLYGTVKQPIVVIGGSPSLLDELKEVPDGCYKIAVNEHCNGILEPDLAVWTDKLAFKLMDYKCKTASRRGGDYLLKDIQMDGCLSMTGYKAAVLALALTDKEVYIVGMDCYSGENFYLNGAPSLHGYDTDLCLKGWVWIDNEYPGRLVFPSTLLRSACGKE